MEFKKKFFIVLESDTELGMTAMVTNLKTMITAIGFKWKTRKAMLKELKGNFKLVSEKRE